MSLESIRLIETETDVFVKQTEPCSQEMLEFDRTFYDKFFFDCPLSVERNEWSLPLTNF